MSENIVEIETFKEFVKPLKDTWRNGYLRLYYYPKTKELYLYNSVKENLKNCVEVNYINVFNATGLIGISRFTILPDKEFIIFDFHDKFNLISALRILATKKNATMRIEYYHDDSTETLKEHNIKMETIIINILDKNVNTDFIFTVNQLYTKDNEDFAMMYNNTNRYSRDSIKNYITV